MSFLTRLGGKEREIMALPTRLRGKGDRQKMGRMVLLTRLGGRKGKNGPTYQIELGRGDDIERMALLTRLGRQERGERPY